MIEPAPGALRRRRHGHAGSARGVKIHHAVREQASGVASDNEENQQMTSGIRQLVTCDMTVSVDGYASGPGHLDEGFMRIMDWAHAAHAFREAVGMSGGEHNADSDLIANLFTNTGAYVMGRTMFDCGEEPWGDTPPFEAPVFVVTHRDRKPLVRNGGTTFHFVTEGVTRAFELAKEAADRKDVAVSGGPQVVQQVVDAGLLDELRLHIAPVLLGGGMRLFDALSRQVDLIPTDVAQSERATHITYTMSAPDSPA
jgi:dihydrofolate reductase